jgi:small-conductance mechanosensitive channel
MTSTWIFGLPGWIPQAIGIVIVAAVAGEVVGWGVRSLLRRAGMRPATVRAVRETIRLVWVLVAVFFVLSVAQITSVLTVLTVSGILGLVASLALQTTLSNMVSGIMLLRNQVLRVGDYIVYGGVRGRVVRIALVSTWIRTDDGNLAFVGNTSLLGGPFTNLTAKNRFPEYVDGVPMLPPSVPAPPPPTPSATPVAAPAPSDPGPTRTS